MKEGILVENNTYYENKKFQDTKIAGILGMLGNIFLLILKAIVGLLRKLFI